MPPYPFERERLIPEYVSQLMDKPVGESFSGGLEMGLPPEVSCNALDAEADEAAVQLAILQCEAFRKLCAMQREFFGVKPDEEGSGR